MSSFSKFLIAASCALSLLGCAGSGEPGGGRGGSGGHGGTGGAKTTGGAGAKTTGDGGTAGGAGAPTTGAGGRGGAIGGGGSSGGATGSGGSSGGAAWDCLDVPGTLCICYMRAGTDAPKCSATFSCCFQLNATSCECFVADEDCTAAAAQYTQVASCPPP